MEQAAEPYWPFYCEENVWHACAAPMARGCDAWAIFVSNPARAVAMRAQRQAPRGRLVLWDYHAVLLVREDEGLVVHDPESRLGGHAPALDWLDTSFPKLPERYAPRFRVVTAQQYRCELRSDRSHMHRGQRFRKPPPPWPCIGEGTNLMRFVDTERSFLGRTFDAAGMREWLRRDAPASD